MAMTQEVLQQKRRGPTGLVKDPVCDREPGGKPHCVSY